MKNLYLKNFRILMAESYLLLKESGTMPEKRTGFIEGYIDAGLLSGLVEHSEITEVIEEENYKVFGVSVGERKKLLQGKALSQEQLLEIPAYIRQGVHFKI